MMESESKTTKKGLSFKSKLIVFLTLALGVVGTIFYFYFQSTQGLKMEYNQGIKQLETLISEQERCSNLLSQDSGKFDDYEYCRQLLQLFTKDNYDQKTN